MRCAEPRPPITLTRPGHERRHIRKWRHGEADVCSNSIATPSGTLRPIRSRTLRRKCYVQNCDGNYESSKETVSVCFSCQKEPKRKEISNQLMQISAVCEKHFRKDVIREDSFPLDGGVMFQIGPEKT